MADLPELEQVVATGPQPGPQCDEPRFRQLLEAMPEAVYTTDAQGRITFFNEAAVTLWGQRPRLGESKFCGSLKLFCPSGAPLPHDQCPMAIALKERRSIRNIEAVLERPDGVRVPFLPFPTPLFSPAGELSGAVNMLIDLRDREAANEIGQRLAAIVESSDDAILAKDLDGVITSWNKGAERLFGYAEHEMIGRPVTMLIPADRLDEEPRILERIRAGDRIEHYETIRRRKDGSLVEISLAVSPIRNRLGVVVGASKVARDITERKRAEAQKTLLLREMDHRAKNLFTLANSIVAVSARSAQDVFELAAIVSKRLGALARAHALTLQPIDQNAERIEQSTTLHALVGAILSPYIGDECGSDWRASITGDDVVVAAGRVTSLALLLNELATNSAKYGALSCANGSIDVSCARNGGETVLIWKERGGPPIEQAAAQDGFGSFLIRATVEGQLGGAIERHWCAEGLEIMLSMQTSRLA
ncbi:MAG: PAS domain S-box protein [Vitreimonas sp.]